MITNLNYCKIIKECFFSLNINLDEEFFKLTSIFNFKINEMVKLKDRACRVFCFTDHLISEINKSIYKKIIYQQIYKDFIKNVFELFNENKVEIALNYYLSNLYKLIIKYVINKKGE